MGSGVEVGSGVEWLFFEEIFVKVGLILRFLKGHKL